MKTSFCVSVTLLLISSGIGESEGVRGFIHNVQVAEGNPLIFPKFSPPSQPKREIPLDIILRMNDVSDMRDFFENFVNADVDNVTLTEISSTINYEAVERSSAVTKARAATCKPELKTVSVVPVKDSLTYYHPSCIRIERCGGCCSHSLLTCTPVESEIVNIGVLAVEYKGGQKLEYKNHHVVGVEKHTKCKCDCKIQPQDCNKSQIYNKNKCLCECANKDSELKCNADSRNRIWSKERCVCLCRDETECATGYYFDAISCRCEVQQGRRQQVQKPWIA